MARTVEVDQLRTEKQVVDQQLAEFRTKATDTESRNAEALNKLRDSFQMVEKAITERDEVIHYQNLVWLTSVLQSKAEDGLL
jgi:hypothetical protein